MKICKECNQEKPLNCFYKNRDTLTTKCKQCINERSRIYNNIYRKKEVEKVKAWNAKTKEKIKADPTKVERINKLKRENARKNFIRRLWKGAQARAIKNDLEFNILESDIIVPEICPILEIPIFAGDKNNYANSPSLDRIDNSKGYIKNNIRVISMKANTMKSNASKELLLKFCKNIPNYIENNDIVQTIEKHKSIELEDKELLR